MQNYDFSTKKRYISIKKQYICVKIWFIRHFE